MKKVTPIADRLLIEIVENTDTAMTSGIVLPDTVKNDMPVIGKVKEVGNSDLINVKKGEYVLFAKFAGSEVVVKNKEHLLIKWEDVLAVVEL